jgi:hypothetical protein
LAKKGKKVKLVDGEEEEVGGEAGSVDGGGADEIEEDLGN